MKRSVCILIGSSVILAGCGPSSNGSAANEASGNAVKPPKKPAYCFFKDDELKGWKISRDRNGDITVEGQAHVQDPRYKASFGKIEVGPRKAILVPTIVQNDTGYATPDNWWHVGATSPNSALLNEASVECGDKVVADLQLPPKG
ncbi:MAG TPA: hypothetical protein VGU01_09705 [Sphingomicrobium sp.]|nr:hypothetical protein [Sphingomicrobium sp.]